jgi:hypothetical protein
MGGAARPDRTSSARAADRRSAGKSPAADAARAATDCDGRPESSPVRSEQPPLDPRKLVLRGRLVRLKTQEILFSPEQRAIATLNPTAAAIWRALDRGMSPPAVASELAQRGAGVREAREFVDTALAEWLQLGLVMPSVGPERGALAQIIHLHDLRARIEYPDAKAAATANVLRHLEVDGETADVSFEFVEYRGCMHLFRNGEWLTLCAPDEMAPVLKGHLLTEVLERGSYELALHTASLVRSGRMLLLCGSPGAGKSTLTQALVHAGFGFAGDDVALLLMGGSAVGLPFAPAIKAGAWRLLAQYLPGLASAPVFRRLDRRRVRYPVPETSLPCTPRPVGWVVLLDRRAGAQPRLTPVEPVEALTGMLNGAFAVEEELTEAGFAALVSIIASVPTLSLTYSGLADAARLLSDTCP